MRPFALGVFAAIAVGVVGTALAQINLGEPRDDLNRFQGFYRADGAPEHRRWFVAEIDSLYGEPFPPGFLMIGAMWGDVAPWRMASSSDVVFVRPELNEWEPEIVVEFVLGDDGRALAYDITYGDQPTERLMRIGDLPTDI